MSSSTFLGDFWGYQDGFIDNDDDVTYTALERAVEKLTWNSSKIEPTSTSTITTSMSSRSGPRPRSIVARPPAGMLFRSKQMRLQGHGPGSLFRRTGKVY